MNDQIVWTTDRIPPTAASIQPDGQPDLERLFADPRLLKPHPVASKMPPPAPEVYAVMRESIRRYGVLSESLVMPDGTQITGHTRCRAAIEEGCFVVPVRVMHGCSDADALEIALSENFLRRQMTPAQRVAWITDADIHGPLLASTKAESKARMAAAASRKKQGEADLPQPSKRGPQSRDVLGRRAAVSGRAVDYAMRAWESEPEKMKLLANCKIDVSIEEMARWGNPRPRPQKTTKKTEQQDRSGTPSAAESGSAPATNNLGTVPTMDMDAYADAPGEWDAERATATPAPDATVTVSAVPSSQQEAATPLAVSTHSSLDEVTLVPPHDDQHGSSRSALGPGLASSSDHGRRRVAPSAKRERGNSHARHLQKHEDNLVRAVIAFLDEGWRPRNIYYMIHRGVRRALDLRAEQAASAKSGDILDMIDAIAGMDPPYGATK